MNGKSLNNAFKAVAVLVVITAVCVAVLTLCNMFFPKYTPVLDAQTAKLINGICPTGMSDGDAMSDGYIVLMKDGDYGADTAAFNKSNKAKKAEVLAVYGEPKGEYAGAYIIESKSAGRDGDVVVLTAYYGKRIVGATVKKQGESYWSKLPADLFEVLNGADAFENVDLLGEFGKTGATLSLTAVERAVNIANSYAKQYDLDITASLTGGISVGAVACAEVTYE